MTTLASYQCLERATALLRARVIFLGDFFFCSFFIVLTRFLCSFLFFAYLVTYYKFNDIK